MITINWLHDFLFIYFYQHAHNNETHIKEITLNLFFSCAIHVKLTSLFAF